MQQEEGMDVDDCSRGGEASTTLKRQRDFSSSEDNDPSSQEPLGSVKRCCLHPSGEENLNPLLQRVGSPIRPRLWEQEVKPDTPAVPSVQSRLHLLTQRPKEGWVSPASCTVFSEAAPLAMRCLSDPGWEGLHSCSPHAEGEEFREELRLIGDAEFRSRVELFEWHPPPDGPSLQSPHLCFISSSIRSIQFKLQSAETPSSSRAEQIHQERAQHLRLLSSQSIRDNAWLKRSWSEPFLAKQLGRGVQAKDSGNTEGPPELDDHSKVEEHLSLSLETSPQIRDTEKHEEAQSPMNKNAVPREEQSTDEHQEGAAYSTGEHGEEGSSPTSEHGEEWSSPTGEHGEEGSSPTGEHGEEGSSPTGEHGEEGSSPTGERGEEGSSPTGERGEEGSSPTGERGEEGSSPTGERGEEGSSPTGERGEEGSSPTGEHGEEGSSPTGEHGEEGSSPTGERGEEGSSPTGEHGEEGSSPTGERGEEGSSPTGERGEEGSSPTGERGEEGSSPTGERGEEGSSPTGERGEEGSSPTGERGEEGSSPTGEHGEEWSSPTGEHGEKGSSPTGEHAEEGSSPTGEHAEEGSSPTGEHAEEGSSPTGEHAEEGSSPTGEHGEEWSSPTGEHGEEWSSPTGEHGEEGSSPTGEHGEEEACSTAEHGGEGSSPTGEHGELEACSAAEQGEEGSSPTSEHGEEGSSPTGEHVEEAVYSTAEHGGEGSSPTGHHGEEGSAPTGEHVEEAVYSTAENGKEGWSSNDLRKEAETPSAPSQEEVRSCIWENEGLSSGQLEKAGSQGSLQEEAPFPSEEREEAGCLEAELSSQEEMNTSEMIDQMFKGVLDITEEEEEGAGSGIGPEPGEKRKEPKESMKTVEVEESKLPDCAVDKLLSIPSSWVLSPLSKAVEAELTLLGLGSSHLPDPLPLLLNPEELTPPPEVDSVLLYSIDAYRTQRQTSQQAVQSVTPPVHRRAPERSCLLPPVNVKEKIMLLNEEAARMQRMVMQTLQALSCCTDQGHGKGSLEEAEAEKLLLVSCEKRSALLSEVSQLREGGGRDRGLDSDILDLEPCRGTVTISNLQLPLKVEFLCSTHMRTGQPTQYYFVLIRYGAYNIVATPLATVADAQNGDTVSFPTSITLQDIRSNFQIDVEVYSLFTPGNKFNMEQCSTKYKVTLKRLLKSITRSNRSITAPPAATLPSISSRRSSNFSLIGSHKITLASLGQSKFPLDKVPFLSPLEGNICLRLQCEGHSHIQHHGFLTMFEDACGFGVWNRRWFSLEGSSLSYWSYPNYEHRKAAEGSISLASCISPCVRPVNRDLCARPCTFELMSTRTLQQDRLPVFHKCWFSADTGEERAEWMEKLKQTLLDLHTWRPCPVTPDPQPSGPSRESML